MLTEKEQILSEAVRKFPILYDKKDRCFKDKNKKKLAWEDVAKEANLKNGKKNLFSRMNLYWCQICLEY